MRAFNNVALLVGTLGLGACLSPAPREFAAESPGAQRVALVDYLEVLQTVDVEIGGRRLPFLFDTAGGATLVTPALANDIGCEPFGRATGFRHDGSRIDVQRCGPVDLHLDGLPLRAEAGVFDLMALLPPGAPELGGILSLHTLGKRPWTLEMSARTLTLETPESLALTTAGVSPSTHRLAEPGSKQRLHLDIEPLAFETVS